MTTKASDTPRSGALILLSVLAAASLGWAVFLWRSLIEARRGAETFCAFGATDCAALWDGPFASWIHTVTNLPVAGWGVIWGVVAFALPMLVLFGIGRIGPLGDLPSGIKLIAAGGLVGVVVLLLASAREGGFCGNCAITYGLTLVYAAVAYLGLPKGVPLWAERGVFSTVLLTVLTYGALLVPGLRTPPASAETALAAVERAAAQIGQQPASSTPSNDDAHAPDAHIPNEDELLSFLGSLEDPVRESLATTLARYRNATARPTDPPRDAFGNPEAPVIIAEFADFLCSHCASLHETLHALLENAGTRFGVDARQYPLDGSCNARLPGGGVNSVRCLAAKVAICMEGRPNRFDMASDLFASQRSLTTEKVLEIANGYIDQMSLDACLTDPATERKLADDVAFAGRHDPTGTPLVLVNGREASNYGPLLFALILAEGDADHPAFSTLPAAAGRP